MGVQYEYTKKIMAKKLGQVILAKQQENYIKFIGTSTMNRAGVCP